MERLSEKVKRLGLRKTLALATIAVLIALLACSGPASTPDTVGTRPPAKSEAMPQETSTGPSGPIPTETPNLIDAATAEPPISSSPSVTIVPTSVTEPATPGPTVAPTPTNSGVTAVPATSTPAPKPTNQTRPTPAPRPTATPTSTREPAKPAMTLTITVAPIPSDIPEYSRSQWKHWADEDGDCQDARQEVLIAESLVEVMFESGRRCRAKPAGGTGPSPGPTWNCPETWMWTTWSGSRMPTYPAGGCGAWTRRRNMPTTWTTQTISSLLRPGRIVPRAPRHLRSGDRRTRDTGVITP